MATIITNKKGFGVIRTSSIECLSWGGMAICDSCNKAANPGYLVCVLNHWLCADCFKDWYKHAKRYQEDIPYEERRFKEYESVLNLNGTETLNE